MFALNFGIIYMFEVLVLVDNVMSDEVGKVIMCVIKKTSWMKCSSFNFRNTSTNILISNHISNY